MGIDKILEMQRGPEKINTTITNLQQAVHKKTRELLEEIQALQQQAHKRADDLAEENPAMGCPSNR